MSVEGLSEPFFMKLLGSEALTLLFIDQEVHIGVNRDDYHVGQDVSAANEHQRLRVLHGNSFRLIQSVHHRQCFQRHYSPPASSPG